MMETIRQKNEQNTLQFIDVIKHQWCDRCTWRFLHRWSIRRLIQGNAG